MCGANSTPPLGYMAHPAQTEIAALEKHSANADKIHADASRWFALLDTARASLAAAEGAFLAALDSKAAATLAEAAANVRALSVTCDALTAAGGPVALRQRALYTPDAFALFSAGFAKRHEAFEKLKPAARAIYSAATAGAITSGHVNPSGGLDLYELERAPGVAEARSLLDRLDREAQEALVKRNVTAAPAKHGPLPEFSGLLAQLAASLPVVPGA